MLNDTAQQLVNDVLVWIGFGTVIGLLGQGHHARPRSRAAPSPPCSWASAARCWAAASSATSTTAQRIVPVSPLGMLVGTGGTLLILFFYKLLGGYYFLEGEYVTRAHRARQGYGRRRRRVKRRDLRRLSAGASTRTEK